MKTVIYVDGYNLFYGCLKHSHDKWLDLKKLLFEKVVYAQNPKSELIQIKYFTADIKAKVASRGQDALIAQQTYHRALERLYPDVIKIIKGYYSIDKASLPIYQKPPDKNNKVDVWRLEEKQTDVNIALEAYRDAAKGVVKQQVFISNDTDLAPALNAIREDFGDNVILGVVIPIRKVKGKRSHRPCNQQLSQYANWTRHHITELEIAESQLPEMIPTNKKPITKPKYW